MEIETLVKPAADWTRQTWAERVDHAGSLLFVHGYITEAQRSAITKKLNKQFADGLSSGRIVDANLSGRTKALGAVHTLTEGN